MIISHKHQFIFLKSTKTAGTSIEIALSKFCGPGDVITPIVEEDEATRRALGYPGPQNYVSPWWTYRPWQLRRLWETGRRPRRYWNHIEAVRVRRLLDPEVWQRYYKFCVVRNPWDRVVSHYYWTYRDGPRPPLSAYLQTDGPRRLNAKGYRLYTVDGTVVVDRLCRFERLAEELEEVRVRLGLPEPLELPRAKSRFRPARGQSRETYRETFTETDQDVVAKVFADEIALLNYTF